MKKFTFLFLFVFIAAMGMAQIDAGNGLFEFAAEDNLFENSATEPDATVEGVFQWDFDLGETFSVDPTFISGINDGAITVRVVRRIAPPFPPKNRV